MSQEALAQPLEFLDRIRSEELETWKLPSFFMDGPGQREEPLQTVGDGPCSGFGGIHDAHMGRRQAMQKRLEQRVVRAPENQRVGIVEAVSKSLAQVNPRDLLGYGMLDPSFFHQRDQQWTSLLACLDPACLKSLAVSVAADRRVGPHDDNFPVLADRSGGLGPGLDHSH